MDGRQLRTYLVECYAPGATVDHWRGISQRIARAAGELNETAGPIQYLGSTFVPTEESCFTRFESVTERAVRRVLEAADVPYARVLLVESIQR